MNDARIAIIGGTGLDAMEELEITCRHNLQTPYGTPSAPIQEGSLFGQPVFFLPRHGDAHQIPPHKINYRANIWALSKLNVNKILAITAVGGIAENAAPRALVIPDQHEPEADRNRRNVRADRRWRAPGRIPNRRS